MSPYKIHVLLEIYALPMHADQHYVTRACWASAEGLNDLIDGGYIRHVEPKDPDMSRFEITPLGVRLVLRLTTAEATL